MGRTSSLRFTERGLEKRKACDYCHLRKIKCDARRPECSNCTLYNTRCMYTPHIRKRRKDLKVDDMKLDQSLVSTSQHQQSQDNQATSIEDDTRIVDIAVDSDVALARVLPPLADCVTMIDDYFANFNNIMPLFDERRFRTMLQNWMRHPSRQDTITWASINVALALSLYYHATAVSLPAPYNLETFIRNAEWAMGDLVSLAKDLRCVQVLLGLTILSQSNCNSQSSSVLLAIAVKLSHRMELHRKASFGFMGDETASERANVLWILYILDREISIKAREPYLQRHCDIELEPPGTVSQDGVSSVGIYGDDGTWFNLHFQARVHLARVQGTIYDFRCSISADKLSSEQRQCGIWSLAKALRDWQNSIPEAFKYDKINVNLPKFIVRHLLLLHFAYFQSVFKAHGVYSDDPAWIGQLLEYSGRYATGCNTPIIGMCAPPSTRSISNAPHQSPLPQGWEDLVETSRACMVLFRKVDPDDKALRKASFCTYMTAMIIIIANNLTFGEHALHDQFEGDIELANEGLGVLQKEASTAKNAGVPKLLAACTELNRRATVSVALFALKFPQNLTVSSPLEGLLLLQ